jgi:ubiquinone/menaquinone biosynthesis C-methylase UbiE
MKGERRFSPDKAGKLDNPERKHFQPAEPVVRLIADERPSVVLEVGVGTGYFAVPLALQLDRARIIGLDVEPKMFGYLDEKSRELHVHGRIETVTGAIDEAEPVAIEDGSIDAVLMANLYHELDDRGLALARIRRMLAPKGSLVLVDWSPEGNLDRGPPRKQRVDRQTAEDELRTAGFSDLSRHEMYGDFYTIQARRET